MSIRSTSERDLGFLRDRFNFGVNGRLVTSQALYAAARPKGPAWTDNYGRGAAILQAFLYDQYLSSIEDLAALLYAIRRRQPNGIMFEYVNYHSSNVGDTYALAQQWKTLPSLASVLGITESELEQLRVAVASSGDDPDEMVKHIDEIPQHLRGIADMYLATYDSSVIGSGVVNPSNSRSVKGTHNKIKHGSVLIEDASEIVTDDVNVAAARGPNFTGKMLVLIAVPESGQAEEPLTASLSVSYETMTNIMESIQSVRNIQHAIIGTVATLIKESIWSY